MKTKTSNNISYASYGCSFFLSTILVALGRVLAPKYFTIRMNGKEEKLYANLNLAWELWKDVKLPILSKYEHQISNFFSDILLIIYFSREKFLPVCYTAFDDLERRKPVIFLAFEGIIKINK